MNKLPNHRFSGLFTALVTPFNNNAVDYHALENLVEWQIQSGVDGLVVCGTTGEAPTLNWEERLKIIRTCVSKAKGRVSIIAGTGTNSTDLTVAHTCSAAACGADAALIVTPYYNKPSQEGIARHFETIAARTALPIIAYNVPSRTGVELTVSTLDRLAQIPAIIGIKDATGNEKGAEQLRSIFEDRFLLLSGSDETACVFNLSGGDGFISVISNVLPHVYAALRDACRQDDWATAAYIDKKLQPVYRAFALDTNPSPVKYALKHRRGISDDVRLPLVPVNPDTEAKIRASLDQMGADSNGLKLLPPPTLAWRV
ncbi:4-hydroxy-tetrahydrodipicolinate synthase [Phyllobacterium sp. YR531]|uniref:4-hydroxy-tetrahydrodipicolinate synthase n=1 Tax=Phyllobacterium sp. YR531 TaxID=1144343 RepID=UPI00026F7603|nr:4-hydroxy-tetrahydrodipicolinate synthase [Phyllobacterium sp. YR531]EJM98891.1 dihydrodipicolinate synthase [Phyllobacterium sp. YR531]